MAPKAQPIKQDTPAMTSKARASKQLAAASNGTKRRAGFLKKKPAAATGTARGRSVTAGQCRSIVSALEGAEELPKNVRDMLASLVGQSLSETQHPYQEAAMAVVGEALTEIEARFSAELEEARAIHEADGDKSIREEALQQAEAYMAEQKQNIEDSKLSMKASAQAMLCAKDELHSAKVAERSTLSEQKQLAAKIIQLDTVEKSTYQPLKNTSAEGREGKKMIRSLKKVGKDFGFHDVLMDALPMVLNKQPDRRRTFDGITLQQLESEFAKHAGALEAELRHRDTVITESSEAVHAARAAVMAAKSEHRESTIALAQAERNLATGKSALVEARRRVRAFDADMRKMLRDVNDKEARLQSFRDGPIAAFRELCKRAPVSSTEVEARASTQKTFTFGEVEARASTFAAVPDDVTTECVRVRELQTQDEPTAAPTGSADDRLLVKAEAFGLEATTAMEIEAPSSLVAHTAMEVEAQSEEIPHSDEDTVADSGEPRPAVNI